MKGENNDNIRSCCKTRLGACSTDRTSPDRRHPARLCPVRHLAGQHGALQPAVSVPPVSRRPEHALVRPRGRVADPFPGRGQVLRHVLALVRPGDGPADGARPGPRWAVRSALRAAPAGPIADRPGPRVPDLAGRHPDPLRAAGLSAHPVPQGQAAHPADLGGDSDRHSAVVHCGLDRISRLGTRPRPKEPRRSIRPLPRPKPATSRTSPAPIASIPTGASWKSRPSAFTTTGAWG